MNPILYAMMYIYGPLSCQHVLNNSTPIHVTYLSCHLTHHVIHLDHHVLPMSDSNLLTNSVLELFTLFISKINDNMCLVFRRKMQRNGGGSSSNSNSNSNMKRQKSFLWSIFQQRVLQISPMKEAPHPRLWLKTKTMPLPLRPQLLQLPKPRWLQLKRRPELSGWRVMGANPRKKEQQFLFNHTTEAI